eukprot:m.268280 g.268280  ORF g.268280 m.268280 type:complete len:2222 (+) comp17650_c0_seq1:65-6730(+)
MTSLAEQLEQRKFALGSSSTTNAGLMRQKATKVSLLFDKEKAATLEDETICALGENGLQQLVTVDPQFREFEALFGSASIEVSRDLNTKQDNKALDDRIDAFLRCLCPHMMMTAAHKALNWLIWHFQAQEYNTMTLLATILPYHATNIFVRVVGLIDLHPYPDWRFLSIVQKTRLPMDRATLVKRASNSIAILNFVCNQVQLALRNSVPVQSINFLVTLHTSIVTGVLAGAIDDAVLTTVLPSLLEGLRAEHVQVRSSAYAVMAQLVSTTALEPRPLQELLNHLYQGWTPAFQDSAITCFVLTLHHQDVGPLAEQVNEGALKLLDPQALPVLVKLAQQHNMNAIIQRVLYAALGQADGAYIDQGAELLRNVKINAATAAMVAASVLETIVDDKADVVVHQLISSLESSHPTIFDKLLSAKLERCASGKERKALLSKLSQRVGSLRHAAGHDSNTSLFMGLKHPEVGIRKTSLEQLYQRLEQDVTVSDADKQYFHNVLIDLLFDEDDDIALNVLNHPKHFVTFVSLDVGERAIRKVLRKAVAEGATNIAAAAANLIVTELLPALHPELGAGKALPLSQWSTEAVLRCLRPLLLLTIPTPTRRKLTKAVVKKIASAKSLQATGVLANLGDLLTSTAWQAFAESTDGGATKDAASKALSILARNFAKLAKTNNTSMTKLASVLCPLPTTLDGSRPQRVYHQDLSMVLVTLGVLASALEHGLVAAADTHATIAWVTTTTHHLQLLVSKPTSQEALPSTLASSLVTFLNEANRRPGRLDDSHYPVLAPNLAYLSSAAFVSTSTLGPVLELCKHSLALAANAVTTPLQAESIFMACSVAGLVSLNAEAINALVIKLSPAACLSMLADVMVTASQPSTTKLAAIKCSTAVLKVTPSIPLPTLQDLFYALCTAGTHTNPVLRSEAIVALEVMSTVQDVTNWQLASALLKPVLEAQADMATDNDALAKVVGQFAHHPKAPVSIGVLTTAFMDWAKGDHQADKQRATLAVLSHVHHSTKLHALLPAMITLTTSVMKSFKLAEGQLALLDLFIATLDAKSLAGFGSATPVGEALLELTQTLLVSSQAKGSQCRRVGRSLLAQLQRDGVFAQLEPSMADAVLLQLGEGYRLSLPGTDRDAYRDCLLAVPVEARSLVAYMQHTVALASDESGQASGKAAKRAKRKSKGTSSSDGSDAGVSESSLGSTTEATVSNGLMKLTMMLELLNGKALASVLDASSLVRPLFDLLVLYAQLTVEARTACEASVQAVVQLLARLTQECDPNELDEGDTQVSPLLNILRGTSNPQTHNVVLVLLGHLARIKPRDVVSNSIPLFAFMGSHSVKKADDAYTFGVFKRTLQAIIEAVLASKDGNRYTVIAEVCDVFASSFAAIPSHRRAALYGHLATCLADPAHLFLLCMALLKADVTNDARERAPDSAVAELTASKDDDRKTGSDVPELVLSLCNLLDVESHFTILLLMIELVAQLPVCHTSRSTKRWHCASKLVSGLDLGLVFDVASYPARQLRHLRYLTVRQLSSHLSASATLRQLVIAQEDDETNAARDLILAMSESTLELTAALRRQSQEAKRMNATEAERQAKAKSRGSKSPAPRAPINAGSPKYWSQVTTDAYLALYRTNALLSTADFADVIKRLVVSTDVVVRKKALDMLATRLEKGATKRDAMVEDETEEEVSATVMSLVPVLLEVLPKPLGDEATSIENSARDFASGRGIQQGIVHALTAIIRVYGGDHPELSLSVVPSVFALFDKGEDTIDYELVSTCLACLGVILIKVGAAFLPHLNSIVTQLLGLYEQAKSVCFELDDEEEDDAMTDEQDESKAQLRSRALILLKAVIDVKGCLIAALPTFLSPFLPKMLPCLCHPAITGSTFYRPLPDSVTQRAATVRRALTLRVAARLIVPAVDTCLVMLLKDNEVETGDTIHCTLVLLRDRVAEAELGDVKGQFKVLFKLAQRVFGYRFSCLSKKDPTQLHHRVVQVEQAMVEVLAAIVLKMSDVLFRPLFLQLVDWSLQQPEQRRLIPLFRLVKHLVTTLQQFFVPYFSHLLRTVVEVLSNEGEHSENYGSDFGMLQHLVITSMGACFKYDEEEFVTTERFEALVQPLVDQLNNEHEDEAHYLARAQSDVVPTLTELMANTRNSKLWKKLNEAVLNKTRISSAPVRRMALVSMQAFYHKMGEELLILLPETILYLSELLEDDDVEVERENKALIKVIERYLGEPLANYF